MIEAKRESSKSHQDRQRGSKTKNRLFRGSYFSVVDSDPEILWGELLLFVTL